MTSMTVGKSKIDLLEDRIEALEKKLADQERAKDVQDNYGWVYGVPMYQLELAPPAQSQSKTE